MVDDRFLDDKLNERRSQDAFRRLRLPEGKTDFCSNDYLGIATNGLLEEGEWSGAEDAARSGAPLAHGSTGSRLLAGNYPLIEETERALAVFHQAEAGLLFNSGYDANLGVLSCIPQRGDIILYDSLSHASLRDGIRLSFGTAFSFAHNDVADLEKRLAAAQEKGAQRQDKGAQRNIFVVTESVFSMDGDLAPLDEIVALCQRYSAQLILDEAHGTGVIGPAGEGLAQARGLQGECFARIHTFGKAVGCHGAIVLGSSRLRNYLINFSRSFIYTTALPPASVRAIARAYELFPQLHDQRRRLQQLINRFQQAAIGYARLQSSTPIQVVIVPGNAEVRALAERLQQAGLDIRPILYPTVPKGSERLRIVVHSFNTTDEIDRLTALMQKKPAQP
jgi:8-amino-7-oxononanoate synthase